MEWSGVGGGGRFTIFNFVMQSNWQLSTRRFCYKIDVIVNFVEESFTILAICQDPIREVLFSKFLKQVHQPDSQVNLALNGDFQKSDNLGGHNFGDSLINSLATIAMAATIPPPIARKSTRRQIRDGNWQLIKERIDSNISVILRLDGELAVKSVFLSSLFSH